MSLEEISFLSAARLAEDIRNGRLSSREVVEAHLQQIAANQRSINSLVTLNDRAAAEASKCDEDLARGVIRGPLHGVPFTAKDSFESEGVLTTSGWKPRARFVPSRDATVIARLKAAGAILLGKSNLPALAHSFETDNELFGRTNNPYSLERTAGGSSGGEAAAIASGQSPLGIGSDAGGSLRQPAHFCGIATLKPTHGRIPRSGHFPPALGISEPLWQAGPMARRVADLELAFKILSGPDYRDAAAIDAVEAAISTSFQELRVAFFWGAPLPPCSSETEAAVKAAATALEAAGAKVAHLAPPPIGQTWEIVAQLLAASMASSPGGTDDPGLTRMRELLQPYLRPMAEFANTLARVDLYRSQMLSFMQHHDVLVCPVHSGPAFLHGRQWNSDVREGFAYSMAFNLTGWPAVVVRAGQSSEGLPIGVQLIARPWHDSTALAAASVVEQQLGGWQRPPRAAAP